MLDSPQIIAQDYEITIPGLFVGTPVENLAGIRGISCELALAYGSGGISIRAFVQSSMDAGSNWYDCAAIDFATQNQIRIFSILPSTGFVTVNDGGFESGVAAPVFGDTLRLKFLVTGSYIATTLSARILAS